MLAHEWKNAAPDRGAVTALAANGLQYRIIDTADPSVFDPYLQAEMRGFLAGEQSDEQLAGARKGIAFRRFTGVYDPASLETAQPVGTVNSWITDLALPGGRCIPMWAISGVTVAPTHRRRGIARAMLKGELRTAAEAGVAIAGRLHHRVGGDDLCTIRILACDLRRELVDRDQAGPLGGAAAWWPAGLRRSRAPARPARRSARQGSHNPTRRDRGVAGTLATDGGDDARSGERGQAPVRCDTPTATGTLAASRCTGCRRRGRTSPSTTSSFHYLVTDTPDAYAALWRFVLERDLVTVVKAHLRSVDEPVRWIIADQRAATVETTEHGWLRILDVAAVLTARTYAAAGSFVLQVADPLGFAAGTWRLDIDDRGNPSIWASDEPAGVRLSVNALSSIVLGGVGAVTLRHAGVVDADPAVAERIDACSARARRRI